ncbi:ERAD-associated protein [Orbilia brochopaga]|uniref:ERAD-associated protein n=1 Tax=Orbilia brochopaga TaxID=3140254 RepID=A0AAV9UC76_9PEZI
MAAPSTPQKLCVPASSPYGSPEPLSDMPQPLSPEYSSQSAPPSPGEPLAPPVATIDSVENPTSNAKHDIELEDTVEEQAEDTSHDHDFSTESRSLMALPSESSPPELSSPMKRIITTSTKEPQDQDVDITHSAVTTTGFPTLIPVTDTTSFAGALPTISEFRGLDSSPTEPTALASSPPRIPSPPSSITTTPSIPALKRRRLNPSVTATNKLIKPFKSPLKLDNTVHNTSTSAASPLRYPPSTPPRKLALPYTPLRPVLSPTEEADEGDDVSPTKTPAPTLSQRSAKSTVKSSNPPFRSSFKKAQKLNLSSPATNSTKDPYIFSLEQKHAKLQNTLRDAKQLLEESSQALKIEQSGEDEKLEELIAKWRAAAQAAADHMFSGVEQRVARMGGVAAYREMQNRRSSGGWGFAEDPEDGLTEEQKETRRQAMYEAGFDEVSELEKQQTEAKNAKDDGDQFTMDMMLRSLNIDLDIMGFDKNLQRWVK